jgi:hypothetical protein
MQVALQVVEIALVAEDLDADGLVLGGDADAGGPAAVPRHERGEAGEKAARAHGAPSFGAARISWGAPAPPDLRGFAALACFFHGAARVALGPLVVDALVERATKRSLSARRRTVSR